MNFIDLLLLLLFVAILALGFFQGMIRLVVLILAFYLSLVLASLYYPAVGEFLVDRLDADRFVGQYIGFAMVLFISFVLLAAAGVYTFRYAELPGQLQYIDRIVGAVLGMLLGALIVGMLGALLWNLMIVRGGRNIDLPLFNIIGNAVATSPMLRYFADDILPRAYTFFDPVLPDGAALIFAIQ